MGALPPVKTVMEALTLTDFRLRRRLLQLALEGRLITGERAVGVDRDGPRGEPRLSQD